VIKIGSSLLAAKAGGLAETRIRQWAKEIAGLRRAGHEVLLVSSGAIRAGMQALGWRKRPTSRPEMQACATIGQPLLMKAYGTALAPHRILVAQILLTSWDNFRVKRPNYLMKNNQLYWRKHLVMLN
jgi:glutamate 5-kinase